MEFRILGPLEIVEHGRLLPAGGEKQRTMLALLLLHHGEVVAATRLIDALWGEEPPETAATALHGHVSRLRKLLPREALLTRAPGYLVKLGAAARAHAQVAVRPLHLAGRKLPVTICRKLPRNMFSKHGSIPRSEQTSQRRELLRQELVTATQP